MNSHNYGYTAGIVWAWGVFLVLNIPLINAFLGGLMLGAIVWSAELSRAIRRLEQRVQSNEISYRSILVNNRPVGQIAERSYVAMQLELLRSARHLARQVGYLLRSAVLALGGFGVVLCGYLLFIDAAPAAGDIQSIATAYLAAMTLLVLAGITPGYRNHYKSTLLARVRDNYCPSAQGTVTVATGRDQLSHRLAT